MGQLKNKLDKFTKDFLNDESIPEEKRLQVANIILEQSQSKKKETTQKKVTGIIYSVVTFMFFVSLVLTYLDVLGELDLLSGLAIPIWATGLLVVILVSIYDVNVGSSKRDKPFRELLERDSVRRINRKS